MTTLADARSAIERLWPADRAESWDAVGLVAGDPTQEVRRILLAVDPVLETVQEAVDARADLLLVHHPLLLRGVTSVAADQPKGRIVTDLIGAGIALVAAHTNADIVERGTSGELASAAGLTSVRPIVPNESDSSVGLGRVGNLDEPTTLGALATRLARLVPPTASGIRASGDFAHRIERVAVCGGAGDSLLDHPAVLEADVYITADLRHHPASEARERYAMGIGPALINLSHWASEWLWLDAAKAALEQELSDVEIVVSDLRTDPWDFALPQ